MIVEDENDERPRFTRRTFEFKTYEEIESGIIGVVSAFDEDTMSSDLSYVIQNAQSLQQFISVKKGGVLEANTWLIRSNLSSYHFYAGSRSSIEFDITVSDQKQNDSARVIIKVENLVVRRDDSKYIYGSVQENSPSNSLVNISFPIEQGVDGVLKLQAGSQDFYLDQVSYTPL